MLQPGCESRQRSEDVFCWARQLVVEHLLSKPSAELKTQKRKEWGGGRWGEG